MYAGYSVEDIFELRRILDTHNISTHMLDLKYKVAKYEEILKRITDAASL